MATYRKKHYTTRNYECTNVIACVAEAAPDENFIESDDSVFQGLTQLWIENGVRYYGHL